MSWLAVDKSGAEYVYEAEPERLDNFFTSSNRTDSVELPKGSIKKLIGIDLTWEDEPVELK